MALSSHSWFQQWGPPSNILPEIFNEPISELRYPSSYQSLQNEKQSTMNNFLPFLITMGLTTPRVHSQTLAPQEFEPSERTGPFSTVYSWNQLDFEFSSLAERAEAIVTDRFIPENNLPLGIERWKNRIFVSMPKWKTGVPATLAWLPRKPRESSPKLKPYPNWGWHISDSCSGLTSVFRMQVDDCGRLWILDSGQVNVTTEPVQLCPPQILVFDLKTDKMIRRHVLPDEFIKQDSLYSNIVVDVRKDDCVNVHAYVTDVWRFGLVVYSFEKNKSWRVSNHLFYPDPLAAVYKVHDLDFSWTDGIFGLTLSPYDEQADDRILYFHPMSSFREFYVKTSVICNETGWDKSPEEFNVLGQSRGASGHASASAMDRNGVLFFNYVSRDSVGCWDSRKTYRRSNLGVVAHNNVTMVFPNDLRLDKERRQGIWVITNRLPFYLYRSLDPLDTNFRILHAYTDEAVNGNICDPKVMHAESYQEYQAEEDCN